MTQLQDKAREENWALFQLRSMESNLVHVRKCVPNETVYQLSNWINICKTKIIEDQKARMKDTNPK